MLCSVVKKKRIKCCEFKGCNKTAADCLIKNHGCPEHSELMGKRGNENKKALYDLKSNKAHEDRFSYQ